MREKVGKIIFLVIILALLASCGPPADCSKYKQHVKLISEVNGCKVYEVWLEPENDWSCSDRNFMFSDCRETGVEFSCGKSCKLENFTR